LKGAADFFWSKQQIDGEPMAISREKIVLAKRTDPTPFLESIGYQVRWEGRHAYVLENGQKVFRLSIKDEQYLACSHEGAEKVGDSIALVSQVSNLPFPAAVMALLKTRNHSQQINQNQRVTPNGLLESSRSRPNKPLCFLDGDKEGGRFYLIQVRGILLSEAEEAESQWAVRYCRGHVGFCGYDADGNLRNVTMRATDPLTPEDLQKRNMAGSLGQYPMILRGSSDVLWIVEGGVDALAVRSLYRKKNWEPPSVIVSGGGLVLCFLDTERVKEIILGAKKIWIGRDREKNSKIQFLLDKAHEKLKSKIIEILGGKSDLVKVWIPEEGVKDIADLNLMKN
jgi:hypothetical protein